MHTFLQLNPYAAAAWIDTATLRFGFGQARLVLSGLSDADRSIISSLITGVSLTTLHRIAARVGIGPDRFNELLMLLEPVLKSYPEPPGDNFGALPSVAYCVQLPALNPDLSTQSVKLLTSILDDFGHRQTVEAAVFVTLNRFVLDASKSLELFAHSSAKQLPIVFSDNEVLVGPMLTVACSPCAVCVEDGRVIVDPEKAIMATQLISHRPATENPTVLKLLGPFIAQLLASNEYDSAIRYVFNCESLGLLQPQATAVSAHPDCLCASLRTSPYTQVTKEVSIAG